MSDNNGACVPRIPEVGFIGFGIVNQAIYRNMGCTEKMYVKIYSKEKEYCTEENRKDLLGTDCIIITVPTNHSDCINASIENIVENIQYLSNNNYKGIIAIKSTCLPENINSACKDTAGFKDLQILYWPEFLCANTAVQDFKYHDIILGGELLLAEKFFDLMMKVLRIGPKEGHFVTATEAMEYKYYRNIYAMYKYMFHNNLPNLFTTDPRKLQDLLSINPIFDNNLKIGEDGSSGVGGECLPKDNLNYIQHMELKRVTSDGLSNNDFDPCTMLKAMDSFNREFRKDLPKKYI